MMQKSLFLVACLMGIGLLTGCVATTGNTALNNRAIAAYTASEARTALPANRTRLAACIAHEAALQRRGNVSRLDTGAITANCESYELAYRTSVMAHVRPEWRRPEVLNNTANTTTANLYAEILELFQ